MSDKTIKGIVSPKGHFYWSVAITVVLPLLPLAIEAAFQGSLSARTLFLTTALYIVSIAVNAHSFTTMVLGFLISAIFVGCFGYAVAQNQMTAAAVSPTGNPGFALLGNLIYYGAFLVMGFFGIRHIAQRRQMHLIEEYPFFAIRTQG